MPRAFTDRQCRQEAQEALPFTRQPSFACLLELDLCSSERRLSGSPAFVAHGVDVRVVREKELEDGRVAVNCCFVQRGFTPAAFLLGAPRVPADEAADREEVATVGRAVDVVVSVQKESSARSASLMVQTGHAQRKNPRDPNVSKPLSLLQPELFASMINKL
eukprot:s3582_g7.t1